MALAREVQEAGAEFWIVTLAERHGIPVITLAERLADLVATKGVVLNGGYNAATLWARVTGTKWGIVRRPR